MLLRQRNTNHFGTGFGQTEGCDPYALTKKQFSMMSEYLGVFGNFHRIAAVSLLD